LFTQRIYAFLGVFANSRKATTTFAMTVRLSSWNNAPPIGRICIKFNIWEFLENLPGKIQVSLKSEKNNGYVEMKCQLDATEVFIAVLIACSTCCCI